MSLWGWLLIGMMALALLALFVYARPHGRRPVDPAHVVRDPVEGRIDQKAARRLADVTRDGDPGL